MNVTRVPPRRGLSAAIVVPAVLAAFTADPATANAHGLAGNRFFPGTLSIDDPAVGDDLAFPSIAASNAAPDGVHDNLYGFAFSRLPTNNISVGFDTGVVQHFASETPLRIGFDTIHVTFKARIFEDDPHEVLVATSLTWGIAHSGSRTVGADEPGTLQPGVFFGKVSAICPTASHGSARSL